MKKKRMIKLDSSFQGSTNPITPISIPLLSLNFPRLQVEASHTCLLLFGGIVFSSSRVCPCFVAFSSLFAVVSDSSLSSIYLARRPHLLRATTTVSWGGHHLTPQPSPHPCSLGWRMRTILPTYDLYDSSIYGVHASRLSEDSRTPFALHRDMPKRLRVTQAPESSNACPAGGNTIM